MKTTKTTERNKFGLPNIVIPAEVLINEKLTSTEKILCGYIFNLTYNEYGYCWANNRYLAYLVNVTPNRISKMLRKLADEQYILVEHEKYYNGKQERKIYKNTKYLELYEEKLSNFFQKLQEPYEVVDTISINDINQNSQEENKNIQNNRYNEEGQRGLSKMTKGVVHMDNRDGLKGKTEIDIEIDIERESKNNPPSFLFNFSKNFLSHQAKQLGPKLVKITDKKIRDGAKTLEKLIYRDGYDLEKDIRPALLWAVEDDFWSSQIRSLVTLRQKSKNGEMKFTNLLAQYHAQQNKTKLKTSTPSAYY